MPAATSDRHARAARLAPYFALQLRFADHLATRLAIPFPDAVARFTNLHRRFGLGGEAHGLPSRLWQEYLGALAAAPTRRARLDITLATYRAAPEETPPAGQSCFGCFSFEPPDTAGTVRIHFVSTDPRDGDGPLSRARQPQRMAELRAMVRCLRQAHPTAREVGGTSWLYNLEAYRRLFPPEYGASRTLPARLRLTGSSSWGQFLDHREAIKPALRARFLGGLSELDPAAPWRSFPLPALVTRAPIALFQAFYEAAPAA